MICVLNAFFFFLLQNNNFTYFSLDSLQPGHPLLKESTLSSFLLL